MREGGSMSANDNALAACVGEASLAEHDSRVTAHLADGDNPVQGRPPDDPNGGPAGAPPWCADPH